VHVHAAMGGSAPGDVYATEDLSALDCIPTGGGGNAAADAPKGLAAAGLDAAGLSDGA